MLTDKEIELIKNKIKKEYVNNSIVAKRLGVSRQTIWLLLTQQMSSKEIEEKLLLWAVKNKDFNSK